MAELNGTERLSNVTNGTTYASTSCIGSLPSKTIQTTTYCVIMTLSLIGNLLIVAVFYRNRTLRTTVHYFIVNMAISDLLIPVISLPEWIIREYYNGLWLVDGALGTVLCKLVWSAWSVSTFVSIFSMITIAADRFHAVLFPLKSALISRNTRRVVIVAIWVASVACRAHYVYAVKLVSYNNELYCLFQWEPASHTWEVSKLTWISQFCLNSLSAIVLTVLYSSIIIYLQIQKNDLHLATDIVRKRAKRNRKITCMLANIVVVFYVVWTPYQVDNFIYFLKPSIRLPCFFSWVALMVLPTLYPVINPAVYYIFNEEYRQGFRKLLCCPWPCCNRCNDCFQPSVSPQGEGTVSNVDQVNIATENIELHEQSLIVSP